MLYAASVKVTFRQNQRRLDIIVEADNLETAKEKVLKQARKIYSPGKKAVYTIVGTISETEAIQSLAMGSKISNETNTSLQEKEQS